MTVTSKLTFRKVKVSDKGQISPAGGPPAVVVYKLSVLEATAIMIGYLVVSLLLAWIVYSRRELKETA